MKTRLAFGLGATVLAIGLVSGGILRYLSSPQYSMLQLAKGFETKDAQIVDKYINEESFAESFASEAMEQVLNDPETQKNPFMLALAGSMQPLLAARIRQEMSIEKLLTAEKENTIFDNTRLQNAKIEYTSNGTPVIPFSSTKEDGKKIQGNILLSKNNSYWVVSGVDIIHMDK